MRHITLTLASLASDDDDGRNNEWIALWFTIFPCDSALPKNFIVPGGGTAFRDLASSYECSPLRVLLRSFLNSRKICNFIQLPMTSFLRLSSLICKQNSSFCVFSKKKWTNLSEMNLSQLQFWPQFDAKTHKRRMNKAPTNNISPIQVRFETLLSRYSLTTAT